MLTFAFNNKLILADKDLLRKILHSGWWKSVHEKQYSYQKTEQNNNKFYIS